MTDVLPVTPRALVKEGVTLQFWRMRHELLTKSRCATSNHESTTRVFVCLFIYIFCLSLVV